MTVINRCKIENGERHLTREVTLSARKSIPSKNNFRGITMEIGPIWGITSLTLPAWNTLNPVSAPRSK